MKVAQLCPTLCDAMDYIVHGILQARITGVGSLFLLHGLFPTQDWIQVSHIAGGFFTRWAKREAQLKLDHFIRVGLWSNRISVLKEEALESYPSPEHVKKSYEHLARCWSPTSQEKKLHNKNLHCQYLDLRLKVSRTVWNKILSLNHQVCDNLDRLIDYQNIFKVKDLLKWFYP